MQKNLQDIRGINFNQRKIEISKAFVHVIENTGRCPNDGEKLYQKNFIMYSDSRSRSIIMTACSKCRRIYTHDPDGLSKRLGRAGVEYIFIEEEAKVEQQGKD